MSQRGLALLCKRVFDRIGAAALLVPATPVMCATALVVRATMGAPAVFRQRRPGYKGRLFELYKFRTMTNERGPDGALLSDERRMHPVGAFLRRTSLDELPQILNVLKGDLSLVGPRPLMVQYLTRYSPEQLRRHDVLPGITGWAQVNGRNAISWEEKFALDVWYVDHWSFALDLRIILMTLGRVVGRAGVAQAGHPTMPEFMGSEVAEAR